MTSGSEPSRRATKARASADGRSSHWTSSATTKIGVLRGRVREKRERREGDEKRVLGRPLDEAERNAERRGLRFWQRVEPGQDWSKQLMEAGERQICLRPDAGRPENSHPRVLGQPDGPFQQRRLADPGIAVDQERPAAGRRPGDEVGDDLQLPVPAEDPFARNHRRTSARQARFTTRRSVMAA